MKKTFITLLCLCICTAAFSQPRNLPLESVQWLNPWIGSGNMAGLSRNTFLTDGVNSLSEATLHLIYENGDFRNVFDPARAFNPGLGIESYSKTDNVYLYGRFNYDYERDKGNVWRGSMHPYETPFMLADPVEGDITEETYSMQAGVAISMGDFSAGLDISYDVGIMAKLKDLRNRNTDMRFRIAPGVSWSHGPISLGLSAGYKRGMEKVEYTQIAGDRENYLYYIQGLWFYNSYGYSSAETSRLKEAGAVFGSFQSDLRLGDWRLYNNFQTEYTSIGQTETGYNNLRYGDTRSLKYSDRLVFQNGSSHRIIAGFESTGHTADRYLQQQELDPASGIRRYVSYGAPVPCWSGKNTDASLEYGFRKAMRSEFRIGAAYRATAQKFVSHPISATQKFVSIEPYAEYTKYIPLTKARLEIKPCIAWKHVMQAIRNDLTIPSNAAVEGGLQLEEPLNMEADWMSSDCLRTGITIGYEFKKFFTEIKYQRTTAPSLGTVRNCAILCIGLAF